MEKIDSSIIERLTMTNEFDKQLDEFRSALQRARGDKITLKSEIYSLRKELAEVKQQLMKQQERWIENVVQKKELNIEALAEGIFEVSDGHGFYGVEWPELDDKIRRIYRYRACEVIEHLPKQQKQYQQPDINIHSLVIEYTNASTDRDSIVSELGLLAVAEYVIAACCRDNNTRYHTELDDNSLGEIALQAAKESGNDYRHMGATIRAKFKTCQRPDVDRVALAIRAAWETWLEEDIIPWDNCSETDKEEWRVEARAAIDVCCGTTEKSQSARERCAQQVRSRLHTCEVNNECAACETDLALANQNLDSLSDSQITLTKLHENHTRVTDSPVLSVKQAAKIYARACHGWDGLGPPDHFAGLRAVLTAALKYVKD